MGTTAEKLTHLSQTKSDIRDAIEAKGVSVPAETTFRDYATKVSDIKTDYSDTFNYAERVSQDGGSVENLSEVSKLDFNDGATLNFIPSGKKAGKSYSQVPADGSGDWTVDRNCEATYIDKNGVLQTAQPNEPRYDWSSGKPVLLREGQSVNFIPYSNTIGDANYTILNLTTSVNSHLGVDGEFSASQFKETNTYGRHHVGIMNLNFEAGKIYTVSIKVKPINLIGRKLVIILGGNGFQNRFCWFDLNTGTIVENDGNYLTGKIHEIDVNGFIQLEVTTSPLNGSEPSGYIFFRTQIENNTSDIQGDESIEFLLTQPQLEEGDMSSYIPTSGTTVTRLADIIETTPPAGTAQIIETIDGVEQAPITTIPATYQIPEGNINQIKML